MAQPGHTPELSLLEEAVVTVLFCLLDDTYAHLNPQGGWYASLKRLSDSEVLALALFEQLRSIESEPSFLREAAFSRTLSLVWLGSIPPHSTAECASSGATWSPCGAPSWRSSGGRARDAARRLDLAFGPSSQAGYAPLPQSLRTPLPNSYRTVT
jgi:hypothetical protein